jgi:hypothetical protein
MFIIERKIELIESGYERQEDKRTILISNNYNRIALPEGLPMRPFFVKLHVPNILKLPPRDRENYKG